MKRKQINEMAKVMCEDCVTYDTTCQRVPCDAVIQSAEALYNAGYRKRNEDEGVWRKMYKQYECPLCHTLVDERMNHGLYHTIEWYGNTGSVYCFGCGAKLKCGEDK